MNINDNQHTLSIPEYTRSIYRVIRYPAEAFKEDPLNLYQLISYLLLSSWIYAIIANYLKSLAPFVLLVLSPLSVIPHVFLIALTLYLIFNKIYRCNISIYNCFKDVSLVFIALLPFMSIEFYRYLTAWPYIMIKMIPFLYLVILLYQFIKVNFEELNLQKRLQALILCCLLIMFISTLVFSINMGILVIIYEVVMGQNYVWRINY